METQRKIEFATLYHSYSYTGKCLFMEIALKHFSKKIKVISLSIFMGLLPLLLLFALECFLRFMQICENRDPLVKKHLEGQTFFVPNRSFYQQFFNIPLHEFVNWDHLDFYVPERKDENTIRIFVFGESAMYGLESSARQLEVMLKQSLPQKKWEVYNVSCPGINSHVLYFLAKACAKLSPDFFIIYAGNNETIGPYGEHSQLYRYPILRKNGIIRLHTYLKSLRIIQLLEQGVDTNWREKKPRDLTPFLPQQGQEEKTIKLYEKNLRDMIHIGICAHSQVIVGTLSHNRKFAKKKEEWSFLSFERTKMNECIDKICKSFLEKVSLVDIDGTLARKSIDGVPGYEYFCDNIHFTFEGNYRVALEWFNAIARALNISVGKELPSVNMEYCARYLGWNKATELWQIQMQKKVITDPISLEILETKEKVLAEEVGENIEEKMLEGYQLAYPLNPNDEKINMQLIEGLIKKKMFHKAMEVAQEFHKKFPYSRIAMRSLGDVYAYIGNQEKSIQMYRECLKHYPDDELAKNSLEIILKYRNNTSEKHK